MLKNSNSKKIQQEILLHIAKRNYINSYWVSLAIVFLVTIAAIIEPFLKRAFYYNFSIFFVYLSYILSILLFSGIFLFLLLKKEKNIGRKSTMIIGSMIVIAAIMPIAKEQGLTNTISPYIIGIIASNVFFVYLPFDIFIIDLLAITTYWYVLFKYQYENSILITNLINGTFITFISFSTALINYQIIKRDKRREIFLRKKNEENFNLIKHEVLLSKMNTHFLFNTLNTIASLIVFDPEKAEITIEKLSMILRYTLGYNYSSTIKLEEEIIIVKTYLDIESLRLGNRLQWEINVNKKLKAFQIPKLILQPLVENGIKYNISRSLLGGLINISISKGNSDKLLLEVEDIGTSGHFTEGELINKNNHHGFGISIKNIKERLNILYGKDASITSEKDKSRNSFTVKIEIPLKKILKS